MTTITLPTPAGSMLPDWARIARVERGVMNGFHTLLDTRKHHGRPFVAFPRGLSKVSVEQGDVIADVGAYTGAFAWYCVAKGARAAIAYEPSPLAFEVLALNRGDWLSTVNAAVVGDDRPGVYFHVNDKVLGLTNSIFVHKTAEVTVRVPAVAYADAVRDATIVKVDVEGAEYDMPILRSLGSIRTLLLSFHPRQGLPWSWREHAEEIVNGLAREGFRAAVPPVLDGSSCLKAEGVWTR